MCGIIGYCGHKQASPIINECLKKLEYRGYDSWGISTIYNNTICWAKDIGAVTNNKIALPGILGIGHVRWATHGGVTRENAHPHLGCKQDIAVVHNGIIANFKELKDYLIKNGHNYISQTDTEVIPHLIEIELNKKLNLMQAVINTTKQIQGSYAFLALCNEQIVGIRNDLPLLVGIDGDDYYVSSDAIAVSEYTHEIIDIKENELVQIEEKGLAFFNNNGEPIEKKVNRIHGNWNISKGDSETYMIKEIKEQPEALELSTHQNKNNFTEISLDILRAKQVVITACGSSRYASLVGRYLFSKVGKKFCDVVMASEFGYFADSVDANTVIIAVSQSGETADVMEGVKIAKSKGAEIISIINRQNSMLANMSDYVIYLNCGLEIGVAATKTFVCQLAVFYLLAYSMVNLFNKASVKVRSICPLINEVINKNTDKIQTLCQELRNQKDFYFIARGINFAVASEGSLKLKEISYIHAEGMPAGELKHGTLAMIEKGTPVVVVNPNDDTFDATLDNTIEAKSRGAYVIGISDKPNEYYDCWLEIPKVDSLLYPIMAVIPLQLLAYYMAGAKGLNQDMPRNLAKSVTVK